ERLEEAGARVAALRRPPAGGAPVDRTAALRAARAALLVRGSAPDLHRPLVLQLDAPATIAAGPVPWGIAPWLAPEDGEVVDVDGADPRPAELLARAAERSLVVVVRDAHRHPWMV